MGAMVRAPGRWTRTFQRIRFVGIENDTIYTAQSGDDSDGVGKISGF
jgi:hypothetical protein